MFGDDGARNNWGFATSEAAPLRLEKSPGGVDIFPETRQVLFGSKHTMPHGDAMSVCMRGIAMCRRFQSLPLPRRTATAALAALAGAAGHVGGAVLALAVVIDAVVLDLIALNERIAALLRKKGNTRDEPTGCCRGMGAPSHTLCVGSKRQPSLVYAMSGVCVIANVFSQHIGQSARFVAGLGSIHFRFDTGGTVPLPLPNALDTLLPHSDRLYGLISVILAEYTRFETYTNIAWVCTDTHIMVQPESPHELNQPHIESISRPHHI